MFVYFGKLVKHTELGPEVELLFRILANEDRAGSFNVATFPGLFNSLVKKRPDSITISLKTVKYLNNGPFQILK